MSKYRNVKTELDGLKFDSKAEAERYAFLKLMQKAGEITGLEVQPSFRLQVEGIHICTYRGDFAYRDKRGLYTVEDVKSPSTATNPAFRIKAKLFQAIEGFPITLVGKGVK